MRKFSKIGECVRDRKSEAKPEIIHGRVHAAVLATHFREVWNLIIDHSFGADAKLKWPGGTPHWYPMSEDMAKQRLEERVWKETPEGIFILETPIGTAGRETRDEAGFRDLPVTEIEIVKKFPRREREEDFDDYLCLLRRDYQPEKIEQHLDFNEKIEVKSLTEQEILAQWDAILPKHREYLPFLPFANQAEIQARYDEEIWTRSQRYTAPLR
jgi:hypothetical protein